MTELAFDKGAVDPEAYESGYLTPEAVLVRVERLRRAAQEEAESAARLADIRRLAAEGLAKVAKKNPLVKAANELEIIKKRHISGHNRTLKL